MASTKAPVATLLTFEPSDHFVHFYETDAGLVGVGAEFLAGALSDGAGVVIIATGAHTAELLSEFERSGIEVESAISNGRLILLDAKTTLAAIRTGGVVDRKRFETVVGKSLRAITERSDRVAAFGEMVSLLWDEGDISSVVELETLWNELGQELGFSLLCAYKQESLAAQPCDAVGRVCGLHSVIVPPSRFESLDSSSREATRLEPTVNAPSEARTFVRQVLRRWKIEDAIIDDAALVVSELASNAVIHVGRGFEVIVEQKRSTISIAVEDSDPSLPVVAEPEHLARSGRGLPMVQAIARSWGVESGHDKKVVWAEIAVDG